MKKVILFGAGQPTTSFLTNVGLEALDILVAIDNDKSKQGTTFFGNIPVVPPTDLDKYDYDQIIIPHFLAYEMKRELLSYGVDAKKIYLPPKTLFKEILKKGVIYPFEDLNTHIVATEIALYIAGQAFKKKIPLHLDWGTLIGVLRDGEIILWDDDLDFGSREENHEEIKVFIEDILPKLALKIDAKYTCKVSPIKIDVQIKPINNQFNPFKLDIKFKRIENNEAIQTSNLIWYNTPAYHVEKFETIIWKNTEIYIPTDVDKYLEFVYGDWKIPKRNMSLDDFNNHR